MATPAQLRDYARRTSGNPGPVRPVQVLPKLSETLAVFGRSKAQRAALEKHDAETEDWRRSLAFPSGGGTVVVSAPASSGGTAVNGTDGTDGTDGQDGSDGVDGADGASGVDVPPAMRCPDNGKVYRFVARVSDEGSPSGEWVETTDAPTLQFVPRVGDSGAITGEWQAAGLVSGDDGKRYRYVPRLAAVVAGVEVITGEWQGDG